MHLAKQALPTAFVSKRMHLGHGTAELFGVAGGFNGSGETIRKTPIL